MTILGPLAFTRLANTYLRSLHPITLPLPVLLPHIVQSPRQVIRISLPNRALSLRARVVPNHLIVRLLQEAHLQDHEPSLLPMSLGNRLNLRVYTLLWSCCPPRIVATDLLCLLLISLRLLLVIDQSLQRRMDRMQHQTRRSRHLCPLEDPKLRLNSKSETSLRLLVFTERKSAVLS